MRYNCKGSRWWSLCCDTSGCLSNRIVPSIVFHHVICTHMHKQASRIWRMRSRSVARRWDWNWKWWTWRYIQYITILHNLLTCRWSWLTLWTIPSLLTLNTYTDVFELLHALTLTRGRSFLSLFWKGDFRFLNSDYSQCPNSQYSHISCEMLCLLVVLAELVGALTR